ncbi:cytochrome c [Arenimonas sp.]|uniref:c-type cytochrome n=1 Tax=Arenimonas sp. TaxID=1872635 RepID=UPI0035AFF6EB
MLRPSLILGLALAPLVACADGRTAAPAPANAASGGLPERPAKLGLCASCHGDDGTSRIAGTPHLGGQDRIYLARSLAAYRSGERRHEPMTSLANALQPADIEALAAWYAAQPGFVGGGQR